MEELTKLYNQAMNASGVLGGEGAGTSRPKFGPTLPPGFEKDTKKKKQNPFIKFMHQLAGIDLLPWLKRQSFINTV